MRITRFAFLASALLLSGCVGGVVIPGSSDTDKVTVNVDGVNPAQMQQMAAERCAEMDNRVPKLVGSSVDNTGTRHEHYDCVKKDD